MCQAADHVKSVDDRTLTDDRPNLVEIRHRISGGDYRAIIFHHTDRLARSAEEVMNLVREFWSFGCRTYFVLVPYDDSTPTGRLLLFFLGWASENEWTQIQERTQRGIKRVKDSGQWLGNGLPRFGYTWNKETRERREHAEQGEIVRRIFEMATKECLAVNAICERLNAAGVPTPVMFRTKGRHAGQTFRWRTNVVSKILHDPTYMGMVVYGKTYGTDEKKAGYRVRRTRTTAEVRELGARDPLTDVIIDPDTWKAAQDIISSRNAASGADHTRNALRPFLFRGLATCGNCGGRMHPQAQARAGQSRYACGTYSTDYDARRAKSEFRCKQFSVRQHILEPLAWDLIANRILTPGVIEAECERALKDDSALLIRREIGHAEDAIKDSKRRVKNLTDAIATARNAAARGALEKALGQACDEVERMEARAESLNLRLRPFVNRELTIARISKTADKFRSMISGPEGLTFDRKREILETYGISIVVNHDRTIEVRMATDAIEGVVPNFNRTAARGSPRRRG